MTDGKHYTMRYLPYSSWKLFQGLHTHKLLHIVRRMRYTRYGAILKELKSKVVANILG